MINLHENIYVLTQNQKIYLRQKWQAIPLPSSTSKRVKDQVSGIIPGIFLSYTLF
jgi:hypothetical protein